MVRSDYELVRQTQELASEFYRMHGYNQPADYRWWASSHPQEVLMWEMACAAQLHLTDTDMDGIDPDEVLEES
jgi:hypothetical protein